MQLSGSAAAIRSISDNLHSLARAFYRTGNAEVGDELSGYAESLRADAQRVMDLQGEIIHEGYREATSSAASILNAALAGVKMGQATA
jgi:hypothetical protein